MSRCLLRLVLATLLLSTLTAAYAQQTLNALPAVVRFTADSPDLSFYAAETATATVYFTWLTYGVGDAHQVQLHAYVLDEWHLVKNNLPARGSLTDVVAHPLNFTPPRYRLRIVPADAAVRSSDEDPLTLSQHWATLPYATPAPATPPQIIRFESPTGSVSRADLRSGQPRVAVQWDIIDRTQSSHVVFEQRVGTSIRSVELARARLWVRSSGAGVVQPYAVDADTLTLRLRVIDLDSFRTLDRAELTLTLTD